DRDADAVANLLLPYAQNGSIDLNNTTFIGGSFGNYFNAEVDRSLETTLHITGPAGMALVFNPANPLGGYEPPNFPSIYAKTYAFITGSPLDARARDLSADAVLNLQVTPPGSFYGPIALHTGGIPWLTHLIKTNPDRGKQWLQLQQTVQTGGTVNYYGSYTPPTNALPPPPPPLLFPIHQQLEGDTTTDQGTLPPDSTVGPAGQGPSQDVADDQDLPYAINFDNSTETGSPAQTVSFSDQLDPSLDPSTFEFGDVTIGYTDIPIPPDDSSYSTTVDNLDSFGTDVSLSTSISLSTDTADWTLTESDDSGSD